MRRCRGFRAGLGPFLLASTLILGPFVAEGCPKDCSQHGECSGPGENAYCMCEPGYTGDACDIRLCPKGDDPLTTGQNSREILFGFDSLTGDLDGLVSLVFLGERALLHARADQLTDDRCTQILSALPSMGHATCKRISPITVAGGANYSITLDSFPTFPYENNLYPNNGNPNLDAFKCETDRVDTGSEGGSVVCYLEDRVTSNIKEYAECSNHGQCDRILGRCQCELGFHGPACDDITDDQDVSTITSDGPFYTGTLVRLKAAKEPSEDFNILKAHTAGKDILTITGTGDVTVHRGTLRVEQGGQVVEGGGLLIGSGGLAVEDDGFDVASSSAGTVGVLAAVNKEFHGSVLLMESAAPPSEGYEFVKAVAGDGTKVFEVKGNGRVGVNGGLEIVKGGLVVNRGQSLLAEGASVLGPLNVRGGAVVTEGMELSVTDSGVSVLKLVGTEGEGHLMIEAKVGDEVVWGLANTGRMTVEAGGVAVRGGGLVVEAGGQDIKSGGLRVDGGIEIRSGGLVLSDEEGFKIKNGGLKVTDTHDVSAALSAQSLSAAFSGSILELSAPNAEGGGAAYRFVQCKGGNGTVVLEVEGDGTIRSAGGVTAPGVSRLGEVSISSRASIGKTVVMAGERIVVDAWTGTSFVEIGDDGDEGTNELFLEKEGAETGQLLFIKNSDAQDTVGVQVPSGSTYLFIFDGSEWRYLGVKEASTVSLGGVKELKAAANLDIGDYSLAARSLIASSQKPGRMSFYGPAGLLSGTDDMAYRDGVLRVKKVAMEEVVGPLDLKGNSLRNAVIEHATVSGLNTVRTEKIMLSSQTPVGGVAVAGQKGEVTFPKGLRYDVKEERMEATRLRVKEGLEVEGGLTLPRIKTGAMEGRVDCGGAVMVGPRIEGGQLVGVESVTTDSLKVAGLAASPPGSVLTLGEGGQVVSSGRGLGYDASTGTLIAKRLEVEEIKDLEQLIGGDLLADQTLHNVTIAGGRLEGITFMMVDSIDIKGRAAIDGETFISGSLTVEGTVMGSGPYVDTSDGRFKENVVKITDALELLSQIRGVRYKFQDKWRLRRRLEEGPQIGFIAQEVEAILPELVHTDSNGYKYVAYNKVVPLLVEGLKDVWGMVTSLHDQATSRPQAVDTVWERLVLTTDGQDQRGGAGEVRGQGGVGEGSIVHRVTRLEEENARLMEQVQAQEERLRKLEAMMMANGGSGAVAHDSGRRQAADDSE